MSTIVRKKALRESINLALERSLKKGRNYIVWEVHEDWEIKYINSHYSIRLKKYEIDRNSFPIDFDVRKCKSKIVIGGACVTKEYADEIGADGYSSDAADCVKVIDKLIG